jgi:predicted protein tyrosine phosphatase
MISRQEKKRVLFVCNQNRVRSVTAEYLYRPRQDMEVRSAGIAASAGVPLTQELFEWADHVFVFSKRQENVIKGRYRDSFDARPVVCLGLPDRFEYKSPKLITALKKKLGPYLGPPGGTELTPTQPPREAAPRRVPAAPLFHLGRSGRLRATVWSALCSLASAMMGITPQTIAHEDQALTT